MNSLLEIHSHKRRLNILQIIHQLSVGDRTDFIQKLINFINMSFPINILQLLDVHLLAFRERHKERHVCSIQFNLLAKIPSCKHNVILSIDKVCQTNQYTLTSISQLVTCK